MRIGEFVSVSKAKLKANPASYGQNGSESSEKAIVATFLFDAVNKIWCGLGKREKLT